MKIVDAHFSPDGGVIAASDEAGLLYLLGAGSAPGLQAARYAGARQEQFLANDYAELLRRAKQAFPKTPLVCSVTITAEEVLRSLIDSTKSKKIQGFD